MELSKRYSLVLNWFEKSMPIARTELNYKTPFDLAVAVLLSAQCTDKRVNLVTPALMSKYPTPVEMSKATPEEIFEYISSVTFPNNKSKYLVSLARALVDRFDSSIPEDATDLESLPGIGRKSANVIASVIYNKPLIAVDTHVFRVSRRLGLSDSNSVRGVEDDLTANIPAERRAIAHHWLILHGRYICVARKPKCGECGLSPFCRYYNENLL